MPAVDTQTEEVRVAMALNGGVSLAVWMGGCAVELDRARRSPSAREEGARVYDVLCDCFNRSLQIDILTGSSAGGINGALLSAAMVSGRRLDPTFLRNSWLDLGDLSDLLHGSAESAPTALMQGKRFYEGLLGAFKCVLGTAERTKENQPCKPDTTEAGTVPSLDVTMTDTIGVERRFRDAWGGTLRAMEHRPRFRFRRRAHYTAESLAAAARTSASFPVAFEPWRVEGTARTLAGLPHPTFGIDGGLLDNAPIRAALELIPTKPAGSRVRRYVCYMNGDPLPPGRDEVLRAEPSLRQVGGYLVNLPREAPLVDHLYAIQHAVERPRLAADTQTELLHMRLRDLRGVAAALLETYRRRRAAQSLEELLPEPGSPATVDRLLDGTEGSLPWIPSSLDPPTADDWSWGVRPAERILHLLLDILRPALEEASSDAVRTDLLRTRLTIHTLLGELERARTAVVEERLDECVEEDEESPIEQLEGAVRAANAQAPGAYQAVVRAARALLDALRKHPECFESRTRRALFGRRAEAGIGKRALDHFFHRVLAIEVVRRAFTGEADIESAEQLNFVQLTPAAPTPIFTRTPFSVPRCLQGADKLTGLGLHHFAGFYRRSWRANDFMWGRLDAAARIVDLLLDAPSPTLGKGTSHNLHARAEDRAKLLADGLLGPADDAAADRGQDERELLIAEALEDADAARLPVAPAATTKGLRDRLRATIETELKEAGPEPCLTRLPFTRTVFQRAAQYEIVREELYILRRESLNDRKRGSGSKPLELKGVKGNAKANPMTEVEAVRGIYSEGESLPDRLVADEEAVSDMGLRTIVKAAFVGLAAARGAKLPMAKMLGYIRAPLLAVAGTVATNWWHRLTLVLGFSVAAVYLTSRWVSTAGGEVELGGVELWPLVTALLAALVVLAVAAVPGVRASRHLKPLSNGALALLLFGSGGALAAVLAWTSGNLGSIEKIVFAPGADTPSTPVVLLPLVAIGILSVARLPVPGSAAPLLTRVLEWLHRSNLLWIALLLALGPLAYEAGKTCVEALDNGTWEAIAVGAACLAPLWASVAVALWELRRQPDEGKVEPTVDRPA